jgi:hypothetical protein
VAASTRLASTKAEKGSVAAELPSRIWDLADFGDRGHRTSLAVEEMDEIQGDVGNPSAVNLTNCQQSATLRKKRLLSGSFLLASRIAQHLNTV